jgi:hypothetical protein
MMKWLIIGIGLCNLWVLGAGAAEPSVIEELWEGCAGGSIRTSLLLDRTMPEGLVAANALVACPHRTVGDFDALLTVVRQAQQEFSNAQSR